MTDEEYAPDFDDQAETFGQSEDDKRLIGSFHQQGLPHPSETFRWRDAPKARWINFGHEGWDVASDRTWAEACGAARVLLSTRERGFHVFRGEAWDHAIHRVAGILLGGQKLGRPRGPVREEWKRIVDITARLGSDADDGLVAYEHGMRVTIRSLSE